MHYEGKPHAKKLKMAKEQHKLESLIADKNDQSQTNITTSQISNTVTSGPTPTKKVQICFHFNVFIYSKWLFLETNSYYGYYEIVLQMLRP